MGGRLALLDQVPAHLNPRQRDARLLGGQHLGRRGPAGRPAVFVIRPLMRNSRLRRACLQLDVLAVLGRLVRVGRLVVGVFDLRLDPLRRLGAAPRPCRSPTASRPEPGRTGATTRRRAPAPRPVIRPNALAVLQQEPWKSNFEPLLAFGLAGLAAGLAAAFAMVVDPQVRSAALPPGRRAIREARRTGRGSVVVRAPAARRCGRPGRRHGFADGSMPPAGGVGLFAGGIARKARRCRRWSAPPVAPCPARPGRLRWRLRAAVVVPLVPFRPDPPMGDGGGA